MTTWQHLVVAIADPFIKKQMALKKAADMAARCGARLTLFHAFSLPYPLPEPAPKSSAEALRAAIAYRRKALERLAKPLQKAGIAVTCAVEWDFPAHEAIVRHLLKSKADLLVAESHRHGAIERWLLANTDWELIRACPCPLWFVKTRRLPAKVSVLAAVDPLHAHAKPSLLDDRILEHAAALTAQLGGSVTLAHAYSAPLSAATSNFIEPLRLPVAPDRARRFLAGIKEQVAQLATRHGIAASRCLVKEGDPVEVISALSTKYKASVVVMGAVSRSGLQRSFIGNTAEKLIDKLRCDLLIVKPEAFKTSVPKRTAESRLGLKA
ncbi:MAG: universal stress protein [Steroidobacteraceae bacterium]